jgi:hypothetical protein
VKEPQCDWKLRRRAQLGGVCPRADVLVHGAGGIQLLDLAVEAAGLLGLVDHDPVACAPPDLQRDAGEGDAPHPVERAANGEGAGEAPRRSADLEAREPLQAPSEAQKRERRVAFGHVRRRVERRCASQQVRMLGDEEQRLLAAHAPAEGVDSPAVDAQPRKGVLDVLGHPREVVDLGRVSPRVQREAAALAFRADDREATERRQRAPAPDVLHGIAAASVERDDQWDARVVAPAVPARELDVRVAEPTVVRAVPDRPDPNARRRAERSRPRVGRHRGGQGGGSRGTDQK